MSVQWLVGMVWLACGYGLALPATTKARRAAISAAFWALSFLLLMLLACTRRRHSRHAKPYPKVILGRRKHLFGSLGKCELHSGPPIALLPTAHASCLHPQAPQSACQTIPKSNFGAFSDHSGSVNCILGHRLLSFLLLMLLACTRRRHV